MGVNDRDANPSVPDSSDAGHAEPDTAPSEADAEAEQAERGGDEARLERPSRLAGEKDVLGDAADEAGAEPADEETETSESRNGDDEEDDDWEGVSLEELGAAYAKVMAEAGATPQPQQDASEETEPADPEDAAGDDQAAGDQEASDAADEEGGVTPEAIIEAALFVGHPENRPLKAKQLAGMIRDVSPKEVEQTIEALNDSYRETRQAIRIIFEEGGYRMTLAPDVEGVRRAFYGKVREARLSHGALEVLSLVAYQPGITAQKVQDQRGKESGSLLNQLVRRRLLEVRRESPEGGGRAVLTYFPSERFLNLFDLSSLDDLPQVDEADVSPRL